MTSVLAGHTVGGGFALGGHTMSPAWARIMRRGRVLVVDDDPGMRMLCSVNLEREGLSVSEADDGRRGLVCARRELPDLVLTDVRMPEFDGFQLAEALRRDARTRDILVIFLSGEKAESCRERALRLGALAYLTKPFDPPTLASLVANAVARPPSPVSYSSSFALPLALPAA